MSNELDPVSKKAVLLTVISFLAHHTMVKATLNGVVIAESDKTVSVDGNHYFPPSALKREYVQDSATHTTCSWKG
jgi:uncharacterized protein (DUF427 family)